MTLLLGHKKRHDSHKKSTSAGDKKDDKKSSRSKKRNQRSTSGENDVAVLRAEIQELHEDNNAIRKELDELRRLVQKVGYLLICRSSCLLIL